MPTRASLDMTDDLPRYVEARIMSHHTHDQYGVVVTSNLKTGKKIRNSGLAFAIDQIFALLVWLLIKDSDSCHFHIVLSNMS